MFPRRRVGTSGINGDVIVQVIKNLGGPSRQRPNELFTRDNRESAARVRREVFWSDREGSLGVLRHLYIYRQECGGHSIATPCEDRHCSYKQQNLP
jgi:hypothetical protein